MTRKNKYLKIERKGAKRAYLDEAKIREEALWDGFSGVITNHRAKKAGAKQITVSDF